jgi:regulator of nonsense transcripts 1
MKIAFPSVFEQEGPWRLDLDQTNFIFERMRKAITALHHDLDHIERIPRSKDQEHILLGTGLKDVLLRSGDPSRRSHSREQSNEFHALQDSDDISYPKDVLSHDVREFSSKEFEGVFKDDMRIHSWAERYSLDDPLVVEGDPELGRLNESQVKAMAMMIGKRISLVQGVSFFE